MNETRTRDEITLGQLVRRWWWALVLAAVVAGMAGAGASTVLPKSYQSTATLLVGPINTDVGSINASSSLTPTYEGLVTSQRVLSSAINSAGAHLTPHELEGELTTTSNPVTRLVTITVSNSNRVLAAKLANGLATQLSALVQEPSKTFNEVELSLENSPELSALSPLDRQASIAAITKVIGVSPASQVVITRPAAVASSPSSPNKPLIATLAAFVGLLIGSLLLLSRANTRRAAVERELTELEQPYLGMVDASGQGRGNVVSIEARPTSSEAAEYRMLAARLSLTDSVSRSLLIVDSSDGSAAAVVAANLAAALSQGLSRSVVLADVSTETEGVTKLLGLQGQSGFAELMAVPDFEALNGQLRHLLVGRSDEVFVLPRGTGAASPVLSIDRARALLRRLGEMSDLVVISGPPISRSASALSWARAADNVLFVVDERTSQEDVLQATRDLSLANAHFLGTVTGRRRNALPALGRKVVSRG